MLGVTMANEDPDSIPEQFRQNRPFFMVAALAIVIAVGAFLYVLSSDPEANDVGRNMPPAVSTPDAGAGAETPTETPAPAN